MVIAPNTDIILLRNVPLDNTYTDTLYFSNATEQFNHFYNTSTYAKKVFGNNTYQRVNSGVMRIEVSADEIYNYNYLMFRNTNYGSKWFYAFITGVEYVNNAIAEIRYEIDVMQTYFFDYELEQCYVDRETSATDNVGENILDEPVELGPIKTYETNRSGLFEGWGVLISTAVDEDVPDPGGDDNSENSGGSGPDITDEYVEGGPGDKGGT